MREKCSPRRPDDILTLRPVAAGPAFFGHVLPQQHDRSPAQMGTANPKNRNAAGETTNHEIRRMRRGRRRGKRGEAARPEQILITVARCGPLRCRRTGERGRTRTCDPSLKRVANPNTNNKLHVQLTPCTTQQNLMRCQQDIGLGARRVPGIRPLEQRPCWILCKAKESFRGTIQHPTFSGLVPIVG